MMFYNKLKLSEVLLIIVFGILSALAFPKFNLSFFIWISLIPLIYLSIRKSPGKAFLLGLFGGIGFNALLIYWIPYVPAHYGELPLLLSLLIYFVFVLYLSLYWAVFSFLISYIGSVFAREIYFLAPFFWIGLEYILSHFLTGFPWGLLGYTQHQNIYLLQTASIAGVYGLSFVIVLFQCMFIYSMNFRKKSPFIFIMIFLLILHFWGFLRINRPLSDQNQLKASVIQGNVSSDIYWDIISQDSIENLFQRHLELTQSAVQDGSGLIIWPEFSVPLCFSCSYGIYQDFKEELSNLAQKENITLLLGTNEKKEEQEKTYYYNTALCLQPDGSYSTYYKMHLVPFGEYTPYPEIFSFINKVTHAIGDITPGKTYTLHYYQNIPFASPICYEIIFPGLVRNFVRKGARFLTTITNDGWYNTSSAPYQHFSIAVFRAVENKRFLLRAATTGISGIIDPFGRIIKKSSLNELAHLTASITPIKGKTIYCQLGDFLPILSLTIIVYCFIISLRKKYNERKKIGRIIT